MEVIYKIMDGLCKIPEAVSLTAAPILLIVCGFIFAAFGWRQAYIWLAIGLGAAGFVFAGCHDLSTGFIYTGFFTVLATLVKLFFLIPFGGKKNRADSGDDLYEKFHQPLDISEEELAPAEEEALQEEHEASNSESDFRLAHARELLESLKKCDLTASDRLETDALSHTLDGFGDRGPSAEEVRRLNDCLATILKLTAKYKL